MMLSRRFRRPNRQLNDFERGHVVRMDGAEWSYRVIGLHLQRQDVRQDRMIIRQARTAPMASLSTVQRTSASSLPPLVPSTISRRLAEAGLRSQRSLRIVVSPISTMLN
ncbi:hypothetical protein TNCV_3986301 [Trichonephila clavipes]|nr:hypothetical protein TNCV_3986301 [Trichonephila clavipes]